MILFTENRQLSILDSGELIEKIKMMIPKRMIKIADKIKIQGIELIIYIGI